MTFREFARIYSDPDDPYRLHSSSLFPRWWRQPGFLILAIASIVGFLFFVVPANRPEDQAAAAVALGCAMALPGTLLILRMNVPRHWKPELLRELLLTPTERDRVAVGALRGPLPVWFGFAAGWALAPLPPVILATAKATVLLATLEGSCLVVGCWIAAAAAVLPGWLRNPYGIAKLILGAIGRFALIVLTAAPLFGWMIGFGAAALRLRDGGVLLGAYLLIPVVGVPLLALSRALRHAGDRLFAAVDDEAFARHDPAEARRRRLRLEHEDGLAPVPFRPVSSLPSALIAMILVDLLHVAISIALELFSITDGPSVTLVLPPPFGTDPYALEQFSWLRVLFTSFCTLGSFNSLMILLPIATFLVMRWRGGWSTPPLPADRLDRGLAVWYLPVLALLVARLLLVGGTILNGASFDTRFFYVIFASFTLAASLGVFVSVLPGRGRSRRVGCWLLLALGQMILHALYFIPTSSSAPLLPGEKVFNLLAMTFAALVIPAAVGPIVQRYRDRLFREDLQGQAPFVPPDEHPISIRRFWCLLQDRANPFFLHPGVARRPGAALMATVFLLSQFVLAGSILIGIPPGSANTPLLLLALVAAPLNAILAFVLLAPRGWTQEQLEELLLTRLRRDEVVAGVLRRTLAWLLKAGLLWAAFGVVVIASDSAISQDEIATLALPVGLGSLCAALLAVAAATRRWLRAPDRLLPFVAGTIFDYLGVVLALAIVCGSVAFALEMVYRGRETSILLFFPPILVAAAMLKLRAALRGADARFFARADEDSFVASDWLAASGAAVSESAVAPRRARQFGLGTTVAGYLLSLLLFLALVALMFEALPQAYMFYFGLGWQGWRFDGARLVGYGVSCTATLPIVIATVVIARWLELKCNWSASIGIPSRLAFQAQIRRAIPVGLAILAHGSAAAGLAIRHAHTPSVLVVLVLLQALLAGVFALLLFGILLPSAGRPFRARALLLGAAVLSCLVAFTNSRWLFMPVFPDQFFNFLLAIQLLFLVVCATFLFPRAMQRYHEESRSAS